MRHQWVRRKLVAGALALLLLVLCPQGAEGEDAADLTDATALLEKADAEGLRAWNLEQAHETEASRVAFGSAFALYETCLERLEQVLGDADHPLKAHCLTGLGRCACKDLATLGGEEGALPFFERSLAMRRRLAPGATAPVEAALFDLGHCHYARGISYRAIPLLEEALAIEEVLHPGDHPDKAELLGYLGVIVDSAGRSRDAVPILRRQLEMLRRIQPVQEARVAWALNLLIYALAGAGMQEEALVRIVELRAFWARIRSNDDVKVSTSLDNMAYALRVLGRLPEAIALYEESLAMRERLFGRDSGWVASSLTNLGYCHMFLGHDDELLAVHREAYDILELTEPDLRHPAAAGLVGKALAQLGRHQEAVTWYEQAIQDYEADVEEGKTAHGNYQHAFPRIGLARSLGALGRWEDAEPHARAAHAIYLAAYPNGHGRTAASHQNLARCLDALGRLDEAQTHYETALSLARELHLESLRVNATALGWFLLVRRNRPQEARPCFREAVEHIELLRRRSSGMLQTEVASFFGELKQERAYEGLVRAQLGVGDVDGALGSLDRARGRGLLDLLSRSRIDPLASVVRHATAAGDEATAKRARALREQLDAATRDVRFRSGQLGVVRREPGATLKDARKAERAWKDAAHRQRELLRERALLVGRHVPLAASMGASRIRDLLGPREAMLYYTITGRDARALFVPPRGEKIRRFRLARATGEALGLDDVASSVNAFRDALVDERTKAGKTNRVGDLGHELFQTLVPADLWEAVKELDRLLVVPHGPLHRIPFEALVVSPGEDAATRRYWLDEGPPLAYAPAGSVYVWSRARRREQATAPAPDRVEVVALGNPVFVRDKPLPSASSGVAMRTREAILARFGERLIPLPGTRQEVLAIRSVFAGAEKAGPPRAVTLLGEEATREQLEAWAGRARFLHLATHHLVDESAGASWSRMALTVPPVVTSADDGFLTMMDLLEGWRERLRGCELVVLSGCETNRGPEQRDEGVLALPLGFFHAGAPAVVASLWQVADRSTATLMTSFYRRLADGAGHLEALHEARRTVRAKQPEPYYWAPFVYLGSPGPPRHP